VLLTACGQSESTGPAQPQDSATLTYGYGPVANPAVTYQPDVIVVGGGPKSIRSASADGLVWVIDGSAENASNLRPGKILLATSRAAGRIMSIEPRGNDLAVTLGPIHLGEVLRDADLKVDVGFDPELMVYQEVPEQPGMYRDLNASGASEAMPARYARAETPMTEEAGILILRLSPIRLAMADASRPSTLPTAVKSAPKISVHGFEIEPSIKRDGASKADGTGKIRQRVGLKINKSTPGLKVGIDLSVWLRELRFRTRTVYRDGKLDQANSTIVVDGLEGIDMSIESGIAKAIGDNQKVRIEVPIEFIEQIPPAATEGVPLTAQIKFKFLLETALGGNNATLKAAGEYELKGPLGLEGGKVVTPTAKETKSLIDAVSGISLGVSGIVFTQETRFLVGLGPPALFAGPYGKVVTAVGVTKAADIAAGLAAPRCRSTTLKFDAGMGWGFQLTVKELGALQSLLGKQVKTEWETFEKSATFFRKDYFSPDIPACRF
jgi:hypothetical protein